MSSPLSTRGLLAARYAFAIIAIGITFLLIDTGDVVRAFASSDPQWVVGGVLLGFLIWLLNTWKWQLIVRARTAPPRLSTLYRLNMVSALYGTILPGQIAGEAVKVLRIARSERDRGILIASVAVDRITGLVGLMLVGMTCALVSDAPLPVIVALGSIMLIGAVAMFAIAIAPRAGGTGPAPTSLLGRIGRAGAKLVVAVGDYLLKRTTLAVAVALSIVFQTGLTVIVWMFAQGLGLGVSILDIAWVVAAVSVVQLLPITVASIGTREGSFVVLLAAVDVPRADALALSLLLLVSNLSLALAGAVSELSPQPSLDARGAFPAGDGDSATDHGADRPDPVSSS